MPEDKTTLSIRVPADTEARFEEYRQERGLSKSDAGRRLLDRALADLDREPADAVPGETTAAADTAEAARENALTILQIGGVVTTLGAALLLQWFVLLVPVWVAAPLAGVGVVLAALGLLNIIAGGFGVLDAYTNAAGLTGTTDDTDSDTPDATDG